MDYIACSLGCRRCRAADSQRSTYAYDNPAGQPPLATRGEFAVMQVVEALNRNQGVQCPFCHATSLEVYELTVNEQPLFDYEVLCRLMPAAGLHVLTLTVDKHGGQLDTHLLAHPSEVPLGVLYLMLDYLAELVENRSAHDFAADPNGRFYACLVGRWPIDPARPSVLPQRYTCRGLTREEVLAALRSMRSQLAAQ